MKYIAIPILRFTATCFITIVLFMCCISSSIILSIWNFELTIDSSFKAKHINYDNRLEFWGYYFKPDWYYQYSFKSMYHCLWNINPIRGNRHEHIRNIQCSDSELDSIVKKHRIHND